MKKRSSILLVIIACCFFAADIHAQKNKKDSDGDGVPDKVDRCPDIRGLNTEAMKGCPDFDGDGVTDGDDRCPFEKGDAAGPYPGCPGTGAAVNTAAQPPSATTTGSTPVKPLKGDLDGDGVPDKDDSCPDVPGANNPGVRGCPDRDNDWVGDDQDQCPDVKGIGRYMGCPDDPDPALKVARKQKEVQDSVSIDSLRNIFYAAFDKCYTDIERRDAVVQFAQNIKAVCGNHSWAGSQIAIKPVMQSRIAGKPNLGQYVADIWERETGLYSILVKQMMPVADQVYLDQQRQAKYEAEQKTEREKIAQQYAPAPAKVLTKEQECQQKLYDAQQGRGQTYFYQNDMVIMESYDCATDLYTVWRPRQGSDGNMEPRGKRMQVRPEWGRWTPAVLKKYHRCSECEGDGDVLRVTYDTKTKELPQGYFSGIQTTKTTTTKKTSTQSCPKCNGLGWLLY